MRATCLNMIYELAKEDPRVLFIGSDLGSGTLRKLKKEMPKQYFMEGISEAFIIGMAAGLALEGKVPYFNTIGTFMSRRCFEQIVLDLCLHNVNVRLIGNGGGMAYAPLGPTHLAIEDIAIFRSVPNMTILVPADADEMRCLMPLTLNYNGPIYIRLAKGGDPIVTTSAMNERNLKFEIGKALLMKEGSDALIITTGITLKNGLDAARILGGFKIKTAVLHVPTIKPLDSEAILSVTQQIPVVVTIEEHTIVGGLGSAIAEILLEANFSSQKKFKRVGIPDVFPDQYGSQSSLMARYSISTDYVVSVIKRFVGL